MVAGWAKRFFIFICITLQVSCINNLTFFSNAEVAKLADAQASGACGGNTVPVQVRSIGTSLRLSGSSDLANHAWRGQSTLREDVMDLRSVLKYQRDLLDRLSSVVVLSSGSDHH